MKIAYVKFCTFFNRNTVEEDKTKEYCYKIPTKMKVKKGDFCLVVVRGTNRNEIVKITRIVTDKDYGNEYPIDDLVCLVSKLDFTSIDSYVEAKKRKEILEDAIDRMYKRISKVRILKEMAKADPELMALLDEYEKIEE